jgi:hypothetical protein
MPKCSICAEDKPTTISPSCCAYVICSDCSAYGVNGAVDGDRRQGVKCLNCKGPLSDLDLEAYFNFSGEQGFRDLKVRTSSSPTTLSVSLQARTRNAWAMVFHCPKCAAPNGFAGEGCDVLVCGDCSTKFNPVTGEQTHTFHLEKLYGLLVKVQKSDKNDQIVWAMKAHPEATTACCFPQLIDAITMGSVNDACSHISSFAPQFHGFAEHIVARVSAPPKPVKKPVVRLSIGSGPGPGPSLSRPITNHSVVTPPIVMTTVSTSLAPVGVLPQPPASWTCAFCNAIITSRIKCPSCGKTKFESEIKH